MIRRARRYGPLVAATLLATACGLSPAATRSLERVNQSGAGSGLTASGTGSAGGATGTTVGSAGGTGTLSRTPNGSISGTTGAGTSTTSGGSSTGPAVQGSRQTSTTTSGGCGSCETIGIDTAHRVIHLGLHAPQTGAAPVPLQAFQTGTKLFWENHTVLGYKVVVDFMDDQYNPDVARRVCEQLSRQDFLVIGGAGTDQIQACASDPTLAASHTPYLSDGVTTNGLTGLFNYFAISQTYAAQAPEVYQNALNLYAAEAAGKWAIVTTQSPNFDDVTSAMANVLSQHGVQYKVIRTPKYGSSQDASTAVSEAKTYGATTVFIDIDPNFWIDMIAAAQQQLWTPAWVGPGLTQGEDLVAAPVCGAQPTVKASFLSPFFGLDHQPPGFTNESNPAPDATSSSRDIEMDIYGVNEIIYFAMLSVGSIQNLTRDNFITAMTHLHLTYGGPDGPTHGQLDVYPSLNFNGGHFGSAGAWIEKLDCTKQEYVTVGNSFIS